MKVKSAPARHSPKAEKKTSPRATGAARARAALEGLSSPRPPQGASAASYARAAADLAGRVNVRPHGDGRVLVSESVYFGDTAGGIDRAMTREEFLQQRAREYDEAGRAGLAALEAKGFR